MFCRLKLLRYCLLPFLLLCACLAYSSNSEEPLTLADAVALTLAHHPELLTFKLKQQAIAGARQTAKLRPAIALNVEAENFVGVVEKDTIPAEYTLSISSTIELGGKREARLALVDAKAGFIESKRKAHTLDVLAALTTQFIQVIQLQEKTRVAEEMLVLANTLYALVKKRADAGAVAAVEVFRAKAMQARSGIKLTQQRALLESEREKLSVFWPNAMAAKKLSGSLYRLNPAENFSSLYQALLSNPAALVFADETRVEAAKVQLEKSHSRSDLSWQVGLRQFNANNDTGLIASLSIPLGSGKRHRGELTQVLAAEQEIQLEQGLDLRKFKAQLYAAYTRREAAISALVTYEQELIPALRQALSQTQKAYESGRYSYADWMSVQSELLEAELSRIDVAMQAQLATIIIEQLTAQPIEKAETGPLQ